MREIVIRYAVAQAGDYRLHVAWDPGGSGEEQFEVLANGVPVGQSDRVDGAAAPYRDVRAVFPIAHRDGPSEIVLRHLSGDGLRFRQVALTAAGGRPPHALRPDLKHPTRQAYADAIGEPAVMLDGEHVRLFAPKRREREAKQIMSYLVRAYDELHRIVGVHTLYRIVVYHFPEGSPDAWGGTSGCVIWYGDGNLALEGQKEWQLHRVPHVSGYIEEMAHSFVAASLAQFGWEMVGWSIGARVSSKVAPNPVHTEQVETTRQMQAETFRRYEALGHTFPADVPPNLADRIHAHLLWQCRQRYGPTFWQDFFREVGKERERLVAAGRLGDGDAVRNERHRITVDCFDRLPGLEFKRMLRENRISTEVALKSLHPTDSGWNRKLE